MEQGSQTIEVVWICRPSFANKLSHGNGALGFCWMFSEPRLTTRLSEMRRAMFA